MQNNANIDQPLAQATSPWEPFGRWSYSSSEFWGLQTWRNCIPQDQSLLTVLQKQCNSCILLVCEQVLDCNTHHDYTCHIWPSEPASVDPQADQPDAGYTSWKDPSSALLLQKKWRNAGASSEGSDVAEDGFIPPLSLCYPSPHTVFNPTMPVTSSTWPT